MAPVVQEKGKHFVWCTNESCPRKMACERLLRSDASADVQTEAFQLGEDDHCEWFMVRGILTNEANIFRGKGPARHNLHAPGGKYKKRPTPESLGIEVPDLNVKRHIRLGKDINKPEED